MAIPLILLALLYVAGTFPFAWFRHDDWLILGNAARLPADWSQLWKPTLFHMTGERPWFFRPFFKLDTYLVWRAFGDRYWLWLSATLALALASLLLGAGALRLLDADRRRRDWFVYLFAASVPLHFGSLTWAGEGLMNCPQVFCLVLSLWLTARALHATARRAAAWVAAAVAAYVLSLGFKEGGVLHVAFLFALFFGGDLAGFPLRKRVAGFVPFAAVTALYLFLRLALMPINPNYFTRFSWTDLGATTGILFGCLALPFGVWGAVLRFEGPRPFGVWLRGLRRKWPYLGFVALAFAPYLGHEFFSPGWLYYPGFFLLLAACLGEGALPPSPALAPRAAAALLLIGLAPLTYRLTQIGWWQWRAPQESLVASLADQPAELVHEIQVYYCPSERYPGAEFERVVGNEDTIFHQWGMRYGKWIPVHKCWCQNVERDLASGALRDDVLYLGYDFPSLWVISKPKPPRAPFR